MLLAAGAIAFGAAAAPSIETMRDRGAGVIAFETAGSTDRAEEILREWGEPGRSAARESLYLDYPFLVFAGLFFAGACFAVSERARRLGRERFARLGIAAALAALVAAVADALEDVALLVVAGNNPEQPWPGLALAFASVKFACSSLAWLYALLGWLATAAWNRRTQATA